MSLTERSLAAAAARAPAVGDCCAACASRSACAQWNYYSAASAVDANLCVLKTCATLPLADSLPSLALPLAVSPPSLALPLAVSPSSLDFSLVSSLPFIRCGRAQPGQTRLFQRARAARSCHNNVMTTQHTIF